MVRGLGVCHPGKKKGVHLRKVNAWRGLEIFYKLLTKRRNTVTLPPKKGQRN